LNGFSRHSRDDCTEVLDQPPARDLFRDLSLLIQEMCYVSDPHIQPDLVHSNFFHDALEPMTFHTRRRFAFGAVSTGFRFSGKDASGTFSDERSSHSEQGTGPKSWNAYLNLRHDPLIFAV